jgi:hypothetical protein
MTVRSFQRLTREDMMLAARVLQLESVLEAVGNSKSPPEMAQELERWAQRMIELEQRVEQLESLLGGRLGRC